MQQKMQREGEEKEEPEAEGPWVCWPPGRKASDASGTALELEMSLGLSGGQGSHQRGWGRLGAGLETSCLRDTGGPGGGAMGVEERDRTERKRERGEPPGSCVCHTHIQVHMHIEPRQKALCSQPGCPLPRPPCNSVRRS